MNDGYPQEKPMAVELKDADVIGWHTMYWKDGQVMFCCRPQGVLYCPDPEYQADSNWLIVDGEVIIDWKEHGKYVLTVDKRKHMEGYVYPKNKEDPQNWRKTLYARDLNPVEKLLLGDGFGSKWNFQYAEGNLLVEFKADAKNEFVNPCPGNATWSLSTNNKTVKIDWGRYGKYELDVDVKKNMMDGDLQTDALDYCEKDARKAVLCHGSGDHGDGHDDGGRGHSIFLGLDPDEMLPDADEDKTNGHGHEHGAGHGHGGGHGSGGGIISIGNLSLGSSKFMVDREGQVLRGTETTFGVEHLVEAKGFGGFTAWLVDGNGQKVCNPVEGEKHADHSHFTLVPTARDAQGFALSDGSQTSTISFHHGASPTEGGIMSVLQTSDGKHVGFLELKLHDDAGDLEMWICKDGAMSEPLDFLASTSITVTFPTHDNRSVQLAVRNNNKNEDEDGNPNMRDGKTNYFIFPGESDQDPEFLIGDKFRSTTTVTFTAEGTNYIAPPFVLVPHM